eukprot:8187205-Lingulodinium_polyedra.AAC.1
MPWESLEEDEDTLRAKQDEFERFAECCVCEVAPVERARGKKRVASRWVVGRQPEGARASEWWPRT